MEIKKAPFLLLLISVSILSGSCGDDKASKEKAEKKEKALQVYNAAVSKVTVAYQRRVDLAKNLLATIKSSAAFDQQSITVFQNAIDNVQSSQLSANGLSQDKLDKYQQSQQELGSSLKTISNIIDQSADLKATPVISQLLSQFEGVSNTIAAAQRDLNSAASEYNQLSGEKLPAFKADKGAGDAPGVKF